ncbi:MAG TPA: hypothetical protein VJ746_06520 [Nitrospira sp.]|nr:hypothetical protein [Nitrospira sp.]
MSAMANNSCLLFPNLRREESRRPSRRRTERDWIAALRRARIPLHHDDRLIVVHGHPLLIRLGLYSVVERVLSGEPVIYLDATSTFDPFFVGRLARAQRQHPRKVLPMIHVARAYSVRQTDRLVSDCLSGALHRYGARLAVVSGLFETIYDRITPDQEAAWLFTRMTEALIRLKAQGGAVLLCLCPSPATLAPSNNPYWERLRSQADRVYVVKEEQGMVGIGEEGADKAATCQVERGILQHG